MENKIIKKIERVNRMLGEIEKDLDKEENLTLRSLHEGQRIAYKFTKVELEDLLWEVRRGKEC